MNEPKLEIVEVPDERLPSNSVWAEFPHGDLIVLEDGIVVDRIKGEWKIALCKHLNEGMERENDDLRWFIASEGYQRCDIPACNCNSFHWGHASARLREIHDALGWERTQSKTALQAICDLLVLNEGMVERWAMLRKYPLWDEYSTCKDEEQARRIEQPSDNGDRAVRILVPAEPAND